MKKDRISSDWWRRSREIIMGNTVAEKMWAGFDQVGRAYYEEFGRPPTVLELEECFRFCISPMQRGEFVYDPVLGRWNRAEGTTEQEE